VIIEGTIIDVMETWPLQLSVDVGGRTRQVALGEETVITSEGQPADAGRLQPGRRIRVEGESAHAGAIKAARIDTGALEG
jgi:hypothetical protein